jgi:hypothetical protein
VTVEIFDWAEKGRVIHRETVQIPLAESTIAAGDDAVRTAVQAYVNTFTEEYLRTAKGAHA